jgi:hypothetical protein
MGSQGEKYARPSPFKLRTDIAANIGINQNLDVLLILFSGFHGFVSLEACMRHCHLGRDTHQLENAEQLQDDNKCV